MVLLRDSGEIRENHSPVACRNQPVGERWLGRKRFGPGASGNTIGGTGAGSRNVISGNTNNGIHVNQSNGTVIQGNYLGTNVAGSAALGNGSRGILVVGVSGSPVTGTVIQGNVVSANGDPSPTVSGIRLFFDSGTLVQGNKIGTDKTGTVPLGNFLVGLRLVSSTGDTVGGTTPGAGNLISGNLTRGLKLEGSTGNLIQGNLIGLSANGTTPLPNASDGISIDSGSPNNTVGGTTAGAANVISGNQGNGVTITDAGSVNNLVQGNFIGTNSTGTGAAPNAGDGVFLGSGADGTTIGGASGARNVISGNALSGIHVQSSSTSIVGNFIGTNASGGAAVGNTQRGIWIDGNNPAVITGTAIINNLVSGNGFGFTTASGIRVADDSGSVIKGNKIGTDVTGTVALGNAVSGLYLLDSTGDIVGGPLSGAVNIISGNLQHGLTLNNARGNLIQGNLIGVGADGNLPLGNADDGVTISIASANNTVGERRGQATSSPITAATGSPSLAPAPRATWSTAT